MAEVEVFSPAAIASFTLDATALIPQAVQFAPTSTVIAKTINRPMASPFPFSAPLSGEIETFRSTPTIGLTTAPGDGSPSITEPPLSLLGATILSSVSHKSAHTTEEAHHRSGNATDGALQKSKDHDNKFSAWKIAIITIFGFASLPVSIAIIWLLRMAHLKGRKDFRHDEEWSSSFWKRHKRDNSERPPTANNAQSMLAAATLITAAKSLTGGKMHKISEEKAQHRADKAARRASRAEIRKQRSDRQWGQLSPIKTNPANANSSAAPSQSSKKSWGTPTSPHPGVKQMIVETELGRAWGRLRRIEDEDDRILVVPVPQLKPVKIPATTLTRASKQSPTLMTPNERRRSLVAAGTEAGKRPKGIGMTTALRLDGEALSRESGTSSPTSPTSPISPGDMRGLSVTPSPAPRTPKSARFDIDDGTFDNVPLEEYMGHALNTRPTSVAFAPNSSTPAAYPAAPAAIDLPLTRISTTQNWSPNPPAPAPTTSAARRLSRAFARFSLTGPVDPQTAVAEAAAKRASARASKRLSRGNRRYSMEEANGASASDGEETETAETKAAARRDAEERLAGSSKKEGKRPAPMQTASDAALTTLSSHLAHSRRASQAKISEAAAAVADAEMAEQRILQTVRRSVEGPERSSSIVLEGFPRSPLDLVKGEGKRMSRAVALLRDSAGAERGRDGTGSVDASKDNGVKLSKVRSGTDDIIASEMRGEGKDEEW